MTEQSKYHKRIRSEIIDVYDILKAYNVTCPATAHAIKKLLMPGQRGDKTALQDLKEARASVDRAIELATPVIKVDPPKQPGFVLLKDELERLKSEQATSVAKAKDAVTPFFKDELDRLQAASKSHPKPSGLTPRERDFVSSFLPHVPDREVYDG